jgi:hypothetical protein
MKKRYLSNVLIIICAIFTFSVCLAQQVPNVMIRVYYFNVKSNHPDFTDEMCQIFYDNKSHTFKADEPVVSYSNGLISTNRFYQEDKEMNGFVFGHGTSDLQFKFQEKTVKAQLKYETMRLVNGKESVAVFYSNYCKGFFKAEWWDNSGA